MRPETLLPLPPAVYHLLVALGDGEKHGYAILKEISGRTGGAVRLLPGTLYSTLHRLLTVGWVEECRAPRGADERRRYYRLTPAGREAAVAETGRLMALVELARANGLAPSRR